MDCVAVKSLVRLMVRVWCAASTHSGPAKTMRTQPAPTIRIATAKGAPILNTTRFFPLLEEKKKNWSVVSARQSRTPSHGSPPQFKVGDQHSSCHVLLHISSSQLLFWRRPGAQNLIRVPNRAVTLAFLCVTCSSSAYLVER